MSVARREVTSWAGVVALLIEKIFSMWTHSNDLAAQQAAYSDSLRLIGEAIR